VLAARHQRRLVLVRRLELPPHRGRVIELRWIGLLVAIAVDRRELVHDREQILASNLLDVVETIFVEQRRKGFVIAAPLRPIGAGDQHRLAAEAH
jgi:hypothetical protein